MDVTELLFRLYEGVGAALATRPQKNTKIEKQKVQKWEAQKTQNTWFSGLEFVVERPVTLIESGSQNP